MTPEQQAAEVTQVADKIARRLGARFIVDPDKLRDFIAAGHHRHDRIKNTVALVGDVVEDTATSPTATRDAIHPREGGR